MTVDKFKIPSALEPDNKDELTGGGLAIGAGLGLALGSATKPLFSDHFGLPPAAIRVTLSL